VEGRSGWPSGPALGELYNLAIVLAFTVLSPTARFLLLEKIQRV
jgi:hypothetical protein